MIALSFAQWPWDVLPGLAVAAYAYLMLIGFLIAGFWFAGPAYYPAGKQLGLAIGFPGAFYLYLATFGGFSSYEEMRQTLLFTRGSTLMYLSVAFMATWSFFLIVKTNLVLRGSRVGLDGRASLPSTEQVDESIAVVIRAERHDILTEDQEELLWQWIHYISTPGNPETDWIAVQENKVKIRQATNSPLPLPIPEADHATSPQRYNAERNAVSSDPRQPGDRPFPRRSDPDTD